MSGKDVLKLILLAYGFNKDVKIETYRGDDNAVGYDVYAEKHVNDDKSIITYHEVDCEGLMFHIYEIISFMEKNEIKVEILNSHHSIINLLKMDSKELSKVQ